MMLSFEGGVPGLQEIRAGKMLLPLFLRSETFSIVPDKESSLWQLPEIWNHCSNSDCNLPDMKPGVSQLIARTSAYHQKLIDSYLRSIQLSELLL